MTKGGASDQNPEGRRRRALLAIHGFHLRTELALLRLGIPAGDIVRWNDVLEASNGRGGYVPPRENIIIAMDTGPGRGPGAHHVALTRGHQSILEEGYNLNAPGFPAGCATWMECYTNSPFMRFESKRARRFPDGSLALARILGGQAAAWKVRPGEYSRKVWTRLAAVAERLWSDPPESACELDAVRTRLEHVLAHIRHEHNATATGPFNLEKPEVVPAGYYRDMLTKVGPLPTCPAALIGGRGRGKSGGGGEHGGGRDGGGGNGEREREGGDGDGDGDGDGSGASSS
jgi:hypothetical protein